MKTIIIITPHPDDETLGCGGTILKLKEEGHQLYWIIVTKAGNFATEEWKANRELEIEKVANMYKFDGTTKLNFEAATLDQVADSDLVSALSNVFKELNPNVIYVPYPSDIHSDHKAVFEATMACTKWFRYPSVKKVLAYETLSETDFTINPDANHFRPNVFVSIENYLDKKVEIMKVYESEMSAFPFPRSEKAIRALAHVRGAASGYEAAEAFMLLKERVE